jgi:hypothetical protein
MGSARRVWLWFRSEGLKLQMHARAEIRWVEASYTAIHHVLSNPVYAGAYAYGRTRPKTILDCSGARKKRIRSLPRSEWQVVIREHHPGFTDWQTYEANQQRLAENTRPEPTQGRRRERRRRRVQIVFSRLIVERASPVISETTASPPRPAARTSAAANNRRPRSSSLLPNTSHRTPDSPPNQSYKRPTPPIRQKESLCQAQRFDCFSEVS